MMSNRKFYLFLLSGTFFGMPALAMSTQDSANIHTHTNLLELKPASLEGSFKTASVCFMGFGECDPNIGFGKGDDYSVDTIQQCLNEGYTKQNCSSLQIIDDICPYNAAYGKGCKCKPGLITCPAGQTGVGEACNGQYASCDCSPSLVSCASNQNGSGAYCGGRYESCTCKSEYQYTSGNCTYPRSLSGSTCSGMYTGCVCPSGVSAGSFGCAEYYPSPCSGVCKTAYADNCHERTAVSTPYGCASYWSDCTSKCQIAKGNVDCEVTSLNCDSGCKTTNSCGKCTECNTDTQKLCNTAGYNVTSCPALYDIVYCPYNNAYMKCTQTCEAALNNYTTVKTSTELTNADAYDAKILLLNDITVSKNFTFRSQVISWPGDIDVCSTQYKTRPTLNINTFTMEDNSTYHHIGTNIKSKYVIIPANIAIEFHGDMTTDFFNNNGTEITFGGNVTVDTWNQNTNNGSIRIDGAYSNALIPMFGYNNEKISTVKINNFSKNTSGATFTSGWSIDNSHVYIPANMFSATYGEIGLQCKADFNVEGYNSYCGDIRFYSWGDSECINRFSINGTTISQDQCSNGDASCRGGNYSCY